MNQSHHLSDLIQEACHKIAPLWPLSNFVAVNPFIGLVSQKFPDACKIIENVTHRSIFMPASFYEEQFHQGNITEKDLLEALSRHGKKEIITPQELIDFLTQAPSSNEDSVLTIADQIDKIEKTEWSKFIVEEISKWCSAYYDEGQASWHMPWKSLPLYNAWKMAATIDRTPEIIGMLNFRKQLKTLPEDPVAMITLALNAFASETKEKDLLLYRELMSINGWSSYIQYRVREALSSEKQDTNLVGLLAIRMAYDLILFRNKKNNLSFKKSELKGALKNSNFSFYWQEAYEIGFQRNFINKLSTQTRVLEQKSDEQKNIQAVFCIDVRSERFRRSFESLSKQIQTIGFAGFFGFPVEYLSLDQKEKKIQCPVLIRPKFSIKEISKDKSPGPIKNILNNNLLSEAIYKAWKAFKQSAVSCFSFVETIGLFYTFPLIQKTLCSLYDKAPPSCGHHLLNKKTSLDIEKKGTSDIGIPEEDQIALAAEALKNMGLTTQFAPSILICGHGSTSRNNAYASSLDCGACGGYSGDINARVASMIFNSSCVREGLQKKGITIPEETYFFAGLHNTTTDEVTILDEELVPTTHKAQLDHLKQILDKASDLTRTERSQFFNIPTHLKKSPKQLHKTFLSRADDWSQIMPEWGLANNAAFIAAPRERTKSLNLNARVFLHDYDASSDKDQHILEMIMSAPMVVANWINLQYYASTVNNQFFGSGNKVLHNVTSNLGVFEGNAGDLSVGLPLQSLHNGKKFIHDPLRLSVFIEAENKNINSIIKKNTAVRELLENGWVHLFSIEPQGNKYARYVNNYEWEICKLAS